MGPREGRPAGLGHHRHLPGKKYEGRVSFIAQEAEFTPKNVQTQKERVKLVYPHQDRHHESQHGTQARHAGRRGDRNRDSGSG